MVALIKEIWPTFAAVVVLVVDVFAVGHAILYKRDPRAAVSWIGIIVVFPFVGAIVYILMGINRIQRRATSLRMRVDAAAVPADAELEEALLRGVIPATSHHLLAIARVTRRLTGRPVLPGNALQPLRNGDGAYPAMIAAIERAERSISLSTYIFAHDHVGLAFADALGRAAKRGVEVRVLIDDVGARYSFPTMQPHLRRQGAKVATFIPTFFHWRMPYANLRSHRKILVVDGSLGFTGGINIRENNVLGRAPRDPVQDLHFEVRGPVVGHLQETFAEDWAFSDGERLTGPAWFPSLEHEGGTPARGITDGPDEDFDKLRRSIMGALACAQRRVRIATPYFLPDLALINMLNVTAMRGVAVEILLPERSNLRAVGWACMAQLWQVLERGCRVWLTPPPFDHTKIMLVDDAWAMIGSGNWDARSLRLNFEFNVECYDGDFAAVLGAILDEKKETARELGLAEVDGRSLHVRLRDGIARLFTPYL